MSKETVKSGCDVHADVSRNLIRIRYVGQVTPAAMKQGLEAVKAALPKLHAGFTVLTDLSDLDAMDLDCVSDLTKVMDACRVKGLGRVVRIIPDPTKDIGFNILAIVHYRRGVRMATCETPAEAERLLAG